MKSRLRLAVPCEGNQVCPHFGHAPEFAFLDADPETGTVEHEETLPAPPHQPGALPKWVADQGATVVLAGGMGGRAVELFAQHGVEVVIGVTMATPREAVEDYLKGSLQPGANPCDHGRGGPRKCHH